MDKFINNSIIIKFANTHAEIDKCYEVMTELRPHIKRENFASQILRQQQQGYHLAYLQDHGEILTVAGYRYLEFLVCGKFLYIDDLVSASHSRKKGYATQLLNWLKEQAKSNGCHSIRLDSGYHRHEAHRLYLQHGFDLVAHHFSLSIMI